MLSAILRMIETAVGHVPPDLRIELPLAMPAWREQPLQSAPKRKAQERAKAAAAA